MKKKVFVTGCFDMLHSGHVAFLQEAATYGSVHVGLGSDNTVFELKGRYPVNNQDERKYMLQALRSVDSCEINTGKGIIDFKETLQNVAPDIFIVNEDGNTPEKEAFIRELNIQYVVLKRQPFANLPGRSTTALRTVNTIPFRIDLAGGWLDQPFVSRHHSGSVITISIEPTIEFNERSGMASSTRRKAIELWNSDLPSGNPEKLSKILFTYDNPPGTTEFSGSQDALGIVMPGLNRLFYDGEYWPSRIDSIQQEDILSWIENHLFLINLGPRTTEYNVLQKTNINFENARRLALATEKCWDGILQKKLVKFGEGFRESFEAQVNMFPNMVDDSIRQILDKYKDSALGWKLSGAGGGGYLILVTDRNIDPAIQIKICRKSI